MQAHLFILALLAGIIGAVSAAVKTFTLNVAYTRLSPDGFPMDMMVANGQIDYPIVVNAGDTVSVTVINNLNVSTAIHWHGMFQKGTPWMDGAAQVTQVPIAPGATFVYTFNVGTQVGTYWWHAHLHSQYVNGLRGPFIINDPKDPYLSQYDQDLTLTLTDYFHYGSEYLLKQVLWHPNNTNALEPVPETGLIGGVGRYNCSVTQAANPDCKNGNPLKRVVLVPGKRYRLRLINTAAQAHFYFSIDGHDMTVIEADGVYTNPTVVNQISIHSAQRYSVIITANKAIQNYWIRAQIEDAWFPISQTPTNANGLNMDVRAILSYSGAPAGADPTTEPDATVNALDVYNLGELNGLTEATLPVSFNQSVYFQFYYGPPGFNSADASVTIGSDITSFNDVQYVMPATTPTLKTLLDNPGKAFVPGTFPASVNPVPVYNNEWIFFRIQNRDSMEHPFHLHGHVFYVIRSGHILHRREEQLLGHKRQAVQTLAKRDTIQVPPCTGGSSTNPDAGCTHGFVDVAIKFDNPGVWLFHCHLEWHMAAGLVMTFVNDGSNTGNALNPANVPCQVFGTCKTTTTKKTTNYYKYNHKHNYKAHFNNQSNNNNDYNNNHTNEIQFQNNNDNHNNHDSNQNFYYYKGKYYYNCIG
ncbi:Cupredoxin [Obelidium mucronatum]|nr:Cupredoxin [Obelidium mucronatum]